MLKTLGVPHCDDDRFPDFDVVAYHGNCTDGIAAAAVASLAIEGAGGIQPEFVPVHYGRPFPQRILDGGKRVLFVDFCPEPEQIAQVQAAWQDWFAIDHHKHRDWLPVEYPNNAAFDLDRSGAVLTHDWFHGREPVANLLRPWETPHQDEGLPVTLRFVQDRDLWRWEMPDSREISAAFGEEPKTVDRWRQIIQSNPFDWLSDGRCLLKSRTRAAKSLANKAFALLVSGHKVRACNATENVSEVGEEILLAFPDVNVACAFFFVSPTDVQLSFRSRAHQPSETTALLVAGSIRGGGHIHAAGARMSVEAFSKLLADG